MFLPRLILAILALGTAARAAEPLYQQFRPLASLPWATSGATWEQVIRRLYREPDKTVRSTLLEKYLTKVRASDFPHLFDLCLRLEEEDSPDDLLGQLLRAWARTDARAAWAKCDALYDVIVPQDPLSVDSWGTGIVVLNSRAVAASDFWPEHDKFADAFSEGVAESALPQHERDRYIALQKARSAAWLAACDAAEKRTPFRGQLGQQTYEPTPPTPEQIAEQQAQQAKQKAEQNEWARKDAARRKFLLEILTCPPAEIRARLSAAPPEVCDEPIVARALIRWMDGDPRRGPEIVESILDLHDPQGVLRGISKLEPVPIEFLVEWAILDSAGFQKWALVEKEGNQRGEKEGRPGLKEKSKAVAQAVAHRDDSEPILGWVEDFENDNREERNQAAFYWAQIDPGNALPWIWSHGGIRAYGEAAYNSVYSGNRGSNVFRAVFGVFDHYVVPIPDEFLYVIMEQWSDTDAAACARHGVHWNLRTGLFTKKRMIRLWTGYEDPNDGAVDDRHFGSLRIWAMRKPEQMRKWIRTEPLDDDVREALLWLVDHAKGGFKLRTNDSPLKRP
jgi:hypothetical protein